MQVLLQINKSLSTFGKEKLSIRFATKVTMPEMAK
jgi:hypothetical protein